MAFRSLADRLSNVFAAVSPKNPLAPRLRTPPCDENIAPGATAPPITPISAVKAHHDGVLLSIKREFDGDEAADRPHKRMRLSPAAMGLDLDKMNIEDDDSMEIDSDRDVRSSSIAHSYIMDPHDVLPSIERSLSAAEEEEEEEEDYHLDFAWDVDIFPDLRLAPGEALEFCNWDVEPLALEFYKKEQARVQDFETWSTTEVTLHRLLTLRGSHPLMPSSWNFDFQGQLLEEILFAPGDSEQAVALRCCKKNQQFHATKALGRIFALPAQVRDLVELAHEVADPFEVERRRYKASQVIKTELSRYIAWADRDAGLDTREKASNIGVHIIPKRIGEDHAGMNRRMNRLLSQWARKYRQWHATRGIRGATSTLFALVVYQHFVLVVSKDARRPDANPQLFGELDMTDVGQWLNHALNLTIPVHLARDGMVRIRDQCPQKVIVEDDPDL